MGFANPAVTPDFKKSFDGAMIVGSVVGTGVGTGVGAGVGAVIKALGLDTKLGGAASKWWAGFSVATKIGKKTCFVAGTLVLTETSAVAIEDIEAGDRVSCVDPENGLWALCEVIAPSRYRYKGQIITIDAGGEQIQATADHPFLVESGIALSERPLPEHLSRDEFTIQGRWVDARDLRVSDRLVTASGTAEIKGLIGEHHTVDVYNLEVAPHHTYVVSAAGVLVHNRAMRKGRWMSAKEWGADAANAILKRAKLRGRGAKGARSGSHGDAFNSAATEVSDFAKDPNMLPEIREELLRKATQFSARAKAYNHKM